MSAVPVHVAAHGDRRAALLAEHLPARADAILRRRARLAVRRGAPDARAATRPTGLLHARCFTHADSNTHTRTQRTLEGLKGPWLKDNHISIRLNPI